MLTSSMSSPFPSISKRQELGLNLKKVTQLEVNLRIVVFWFKSTLNCITRASAIFLVFLLQSTPHGLLRSSLCGEDRSSVGLAAANQLFFSSLIVSYTVLENVSKSSRRNIKALLLQTVREANE
jgi:hypothetical protein